MTVNELILSASKEGQIQEIAKAINAGANINTTDEYGKTPLHVACKKGHLEVVKWLVAEGANLECETANGSTAFLIAALNGESDVVRFLMDEVDQINSSNNVGEAPLASLVASYPDVELADFLLQNNAEVDQENCDGWTALMHAAHWDMRWNPMTELLIKHGANVNYKSLDGWTPLMLACCDRGVDNGPVDVLLKSDNIDINAAGKNFGCTPLIMAVKGQYYCLDLVKKLIGKGADIDKPILIANDKIKPKLPTPLAKNIYNNVKTGEKFQGYTPLMYAIKKERNSVIKLLCESGADINLKSKNGDNAISLSKGRKSETILAEYI